MKGSTRVLVVLAAAVVLLAIVAVVIAMVTGGDGRLLSEKSPEGVVQRFLLAVEAGDYGEAYDYLGDNLKEGCTYDDFLDRSSRERIEDIQATLVKTEAFDDRTEVVISITSFRASGPFLAPFDSPTSSYQHRYLLLQEEEQWLFSQMPWPVYWCPVQVRPVPAD